MNNKQGFFNWMNDGNVVKIKGNYFTQCSQYSIPFETLPKLYRYYLKEFIY